MRTMIEELAFVLLESCGNPRLDPQSGSFPAGPIKWDHVILGAC